MSLPSLAALPATLKPLAERAEQNFRTAIAAFSPEQIASFDSWSDERHADFFRVTAGSDFVAEQVQRDPAFLLELAATGELERALQPGEMGAQLEALLADCADEDELGRRLRRFRRRQQVRIIWRDLSRRSDLAGTCRDLSDLADACIDQSLAWLYQRHCQQFGVPIGNRSGLPQKMIVLGMGKLGAGELNLSSDIDLIFGYPEGGETQGAKRALDNQEFFTRLGQKLIKSLDAITVEGFAFRVDMRLRPYGSSGPLVHSFAALEQYYQDQGRDWERYAMIKARVVGGDQEAGQRLLELLRPFVYRRYLDFSAIEALRTMKQLIQQEVRRKGMSENIKLGAGGIREVEFIAQAFQLIHGGRDLSLQQRPLLRVLAILEGQGYLPPQVVAELREGYEFLRYAEHALQAIADRQTQMLPEDELERIRVAFIMGFANWSAFHQATNQWRDRIDWHFRQVIADPDEDEDGQVDTTIGGEWIPLWEEAVDEESACRQFADAGFAEPAQAWKRLTDLRHGTQVRAMQRLGRERLDAFMPRLLNMIAERGPADVLLERVLPLIEAVARRSAYLVLLTENPGALERLLTLCAASPMVAEQIARFPILLDELLNEGRLFRPPQAAELGAELRERLMRIPEDDLEQQMETLRHFKLAHALRVVASEIAGTLPLMKVSDYLTWLAEAILEQVLSLTWDQLVQRHGRPTASTGRPAIRTSSSSATASPAAWNWATAPTWTWCSSTMATRRARPTVPSPSMGRSSIRAWGRRSFTSSPRRRPRACSTKWTCACAPAVPPACWSVRCAPSRPTSWARPGPGSTRRWCAPACSPAASGWPGPSRRSARKCWASNAICRSCARRSARCARRCATTSAPPALSPAPRRMPSRPRPRSISSRMPVVSSISNLWCNTRPWPGRGSTRSWWSSPTISASWKRWSGSG